MSFIFAAGDCSLGFSAGSDCFVADFFDEYREFRNFKIHALLCVERARLFS